MPIGLMLVFLPVVLVWALEGFGEKKEPKK